MTARAHPPEDGLVDGQAKGNLLAHAGELTVVVVAYVLSARLGLAIAPVSGFATLVWPPTGIALAALLLRGVRLWPAVMLGALGHLEDLADCRWGHGPHPSRGLECHGLASFRGVIRVSSFTEQRTMVV